VTVGGAVVYSTCSFAPEENEQVIAYALKKYDSAIEIKPCQLPFDNTQAGLVQWQGKALPPSLSNALRILPTREMDGFFVCCLHKIRSI
jgi:16S rRNA (cytosine1407-C5)-methyltransferase